MAVLAIIVSVLIFNSCTKQELTDKPVTGEQEVKMSDGNLLNANLQNLISGLYIIRISNCNQIIYSQKIVKK